MSIAFTAQAQGIAADLDSHLLSNLGELSAIAVPEGATGYVNVSTYSQPIIYDPEQVTLPDNISWEELFDSKYAGKLFVTDTFPSLLYPVAKMLSRSPEIYGRYRGSAGQSQGRDPRVHARRPGLPHHPGRHR